MAVVSDGVLVDAPVNVVVRADDVKGADVRGAVGGGVDATVVEDSDGAGVLADDGAGVIVIVGGGVGALVVVPCVVTGRGVVTCGVVVDGSTCC